MISAILCHHKGTLVNKAIDSILQSIGVDFEVIVVTSDSTFSYEHSRVKVLKMFREEGPAKKRNLSLRVAKGELIAFFDDDVEVLPDTLLQMEVLLNSSDSIGMVFGKTLNMEFRNRLDGAGSFLTWTGFLYAREESGIEDTRQFDQVEPILAGKSASCMIRRKIFASCGLFDDSYGILGEETDLAWRVWLYGWKVLWCPQSVAYHAFNTRFKPLDFYSPTRIYCNGARNYLAMLFTNLEATNLARAFPIQFIVWLSSVVGMLVTGKIEAGQQILKGIASFLSRLPQLLKKRSLVQSRRVISDRELFKSIMRNPPMGYFTKRLFHYVKTGRHG